MKIFSVLAILVLSNSASSARDFRPESHLENIPASNSSIQQCYIFQTTPGVAYTVEVSNNLSDWTTQDELYGLGGEYAVAMREFTPPPPLPPGTPTFDPPPLATNVSLRLQPASDAAGGVVVAWRSLDHDGPMIVRIAAEIDVGWNQIPIFWNRFADYNFYFWHPGVAVAPPAQNSPLGPKDSAMLAVLEASVPTINQQIAASIIHSRNAPPPAPPDPDSKRFWRVKVDADIDTDQDGSGDWAEFEIAARGTGMLVPGVTGDAFNADTNNDGVPDGQQLDADGDGTPDATDSDSTDNTSVVPFGPIPRYALFEIPGNALQINDLGTVIFPTKVWKAGVLNDLPGGGAGATQASARAINDLDVILGTVGTRPDLPDHPSFVIGDICYWPSPTSTYETIHVEDDGETVNAYRQHDGIYQQGPAPVLTNSGHFIAQGNVVDPPLEYWDEFDYYPTLWQIPIGSALANRQESQLGATYLSSPSLMWGTLYPTPANGHQGIVYAPAALPSIPFVPLNVVSQPLPNGGTVLFATPPLNLFGSADSLNTQVYVDGHWRENKLYANAIDISGDGTAIGRNMGNKVAPILLNGQWTGIERTAPGVPAAWQDPSIKLIDTTPHGWVLARDTPHFKSAVMLPIRVDGVNPDLVSPPLPPAPGTPPFDPPEFLAGGVDHTSMAAIGGTGRVPEIWIMAPNGGTSNKVRFRSPLNANCTITLTPRDTPSQPANPDVAFSPDIVATKDMQIQVSGLKTDSADTQPALKLGGIHKSISTPIKIKIMKKRIVKVAVHEVIGLDSSGSPTVPHNIPSESDMEEELNKVYGRQVNTFFDVTSYVEIDPALGGIDFDLDNNLELDSDLNEAERTAATPNPKTEVELPSANIDVWVIAGVALESSGEALYGVHLGGSGVGKILIDGDLQGEPRNAQQKKNLLLQILSHEIGHVLTNDFHPNEGQGPCVLKWNYSGPTVSIDPRDQARLMCSGPAANEAHLGKQLIKKEWDLIEAWLNANIKDDEE